MFSNKTSRARQRWRAFTLVELLIVVAIIGVLIAILLPALNAVRESGRRMSCMNNLRSLAQGLHNYHSTHQYFPTGLEYDESEDPGAIVNFEANWVIRILPFIEQEDLYEAFDLDEPISAAVNRSSRGRQLAVMLCPSDNGFSNSFSGTAPGEGDNWGRGNYAANAGNGPLNPAHPSGIFGDQSPGWLDTRLRGVMGPNVSLRIDDVRDGSTKTILLGEVRVGLTDRDRRGVWAMGAPGASSLYWYGSLGDANGPNDCSIESDDFRGCAGLWTSPGGAVLLDECMGCSATTDANRQATIRSVHVEGAHVAMVGGSTHFILNYIETSGPWGPWGTVWDGLIGSNDGLVFDDGDWNLDY